MPVIRWIKKDINCFTWVYNMALRNLELVPDCFETQEMCNEKVRIKPYLLRYVPDHFKTKEICKEAVSNKAYTLRYVSNHLKTQEM